MGWIFVLGIGLAAAAAAAASRGRTPGRPRRARPGAETLGGPRVCDLDAAGVQPRGGRAIRIWLDCPGRLEAQVRELVNLLRPSDRASADAVLARWRARQLIETAPAGSPISPETRSAVDRARRASDDEASGSGFNPGPMAGVERNARGEGISPPRAQTVLAPEDRVALDAIRDELQGGATEVLAGPAPETFDPQNARSMAGPLAQHLTAEGANYSRDRVRRFQDAAGLLARSPSGIYDCETKNALIHFGINRPPPPRHGVTRNCTSHPYRRPVRG